jgi:Ax21 family sulfation-dependent quorum factor
MKFRLLAVLLASAVTVPAVAGELSYTYLEGGYARTNLRGFSDPDGWRVGGSVALGDRFHLFGGYSQQDLKARLLLTPESDPIRIDLDVDHWDIGFGYNHALNERTDLVVRLAYEKLDIELFDTEAASLEVGVRGLLGDRLEGWAMAGYADAKHTGGDAYARLGGQFRFNRSWGLVADARISGGDSQLFFGPRLSF